ncbi:MAG: hypothetical protein QXI58_01890 [Candidatus Micrarchaeia archaeon]
MRKTFYVIKKIGEESEVIARNLTYREAQILVKRLLDEERRRKIQLGEDYQLSSYFILEDGCYKN